MPRAGDPLYREELKNRFIADYTTSNAVQKNLLSLFRRTFSFENKSGHDLCEMSEQELQDVVDSLVAVKKNTAYYSVRRINAYCKWCVNNNVPNAHNIVKKCKIDGIDKIRESMVVNAKQLQMRLNEKFRPEDELTVDNLYRTYFWFAFMGIPELDSVSIRNCDVDLDAMEIRFGDNVYAIYRESLPALKICMTANTFYTANGKGATADKALIPRPRVSGDRVLRSSVHPRGEHQNIDELDKGKLRGSIGRSISNKKVGLSYSSIRLSGLFSRVLELELISSSRDDELGIFKQYVLEEMTPSKKERLSHDKEAFDKNVKLYCKYVRDDYERWLMAFGL